MLLPSDPWLASASTWSIGLCGMTYASLCGPGILDSTLLISPGPNPVAVLLCLGLVNSGPTGPLSSEMGALVEGRLSRVEVEVAMMLPDDFCT